MIKLVVFLGNPGDRYSRTRHNVGRMVLEELSTSINPAWREKFHGKIADVTMKNRKIRFLVPETFMNLTGKSTAAAMTFFKLNPENLLLVHDDLEMPFGHIGIKFGGGLAGHNGLKSIRDGLGTTDFGRLRIGIGRPKRESVQSWVLGRFSPDEEVALPIILKAAAEMLKLAATNPDGAMGRNETKRVYG